jgi:hypothetical protein
MCGMKQRRPRDHKSVGQYSPLGPTHAVAKLPNQPHERCVRRSSMAKLCRRLMISSACCRSLCRKALMASMSASVKFSGRLAASISVEVPCRDRNVSAARRQLSRLSSRLVLTRITTMNSSSSCAVSNSCSHWYSIRSNATSCSISSRNYSRVKTQQWTSIYFPVEIDSLAAYMASANFSRGR